MLHHIACVFKLLMVLRVVRIRGGGNKMCNIVENMMV